MNALATKKHRYIPILIAASFSVMVGVPIVGCTPRPHQPPETTAQAKPIHPYEMVEYDKAKRAMDEAVTAFIAAQSAGDSAARNQLMDSTANKARLAREAVTKILNEETWSEDDRRRLRMMQFNIELIEWQAKHWASGATAEERERQWNAVREIIRNEHQLLSASDNADRFRAVGIFTNAIHALIKFDPDNWSTFGEFATDARQLIDDAGSSERNEGILFDAQIFAWEAVAKREWNNVHSYCGKLLSVSKWDPHQKRIADQAVLQCDEWLSFEGCPKELQTSWKRQLTKRQAGSAKRSAN